MITGWDAPEQPDSAGAEREGAGGDATRSRHRAASALPAQQPVQKQQGAQSAQKPGLWDRIRAIFK
jgi:hypothetical protein